MPKLFVLLLIALCVPRTTINLLLEYHLMIFSHGTMRKLESGQRFGEQFIKQDYCGKIN